MSKIHKLGQNNSYQSKKLDNLILKHAGQEKRANGLNALLKQREEIVKKQKEIADQYRENYKKLESICNHAPKDVVVEQNWFEDTLGSGDYTIYTVICTACQKRLKAYDNLQGM